MSKKKIPSLAGNRTPVVQPSKYIDNSFTVNILDISETHQLQAMLLQRPLSGTVIDCCSSIVIVRGIVSNDI
jgi:hypothetical protein